jgi:hypothetical protein
VSADVAHDPAWQAAYDETERLAKLDARAGVDMRKLEGELAEHADHYDTVYAEELIAIANQRGAN